MGDNVPFQTGFDVRGVLLVFVGLHQMNHLRVNSAKVRPLLRTSFFLRVCTLKYTYTAPR